MGRWLTGWQIIRDVILTGTGVWLILAQAVSRHPDSTLLVVALALTVPSVAEHGRALLSGPGTHPSLPPSPSPGPSPPGPSSSEAPSSQEPSGDQ